MNHLRHESGMLMASMNVNPIQYINRNVGSRTAPMCASQTLSSSVRPKKAHADRHSHLFLVMAAVRANKIL